MPFRLCAVLFAVRVGFGQISPAPESTVIKTTTRLVNVNVIATDKRGNPVTDLKKSDFVLRENGTERTLTFFSLDTEEISGEPAKPLPPHTFTNRLEQSAGAVTVFLFDGLNTRFEDQAFAKAQLIKYLAGVNPKDRVALFSLGENLTMLHDFTSDTQGLIDILNKRKPRKNTEAADGDPIASDTGDAVLDRFVNSTNQALADNVNTARVARTTEALEAIAAHVSRIPGRKNLVWISGGFPITMMHGSRQVESFAGGIDRAVKILNDSNLAVYPVDARGLQAQPVSGSSGQLARPLSARGQTTAIGVAKTNDPTYDSLETLANTTGGKAFHNINDLAGAIRSATGDARVTYALGFSPPTETIDGQFHSLKVDVKRPGVQVRYREGYFAFPEPPPTNLSAAIASPVAFTGIGITVNLKPAAEGGMKATVNVEAKNLTLEQRDGKWQGTLQFILITGPLPKKPKATVVTLNYTPEGYKQVMAEGLLLGTTLRVPAGPAQYHLGVRDMLSGAIGTLHLTKDR